MQRKPHSVGAGQGRSQIQNQRNTHMPNETQQRNPQSYPLQAAVMMPGQRTPYIPHSIAMAQRSMRPNRPMYSSPPQGHPQMHGYMQQNMQYQVVGQDPYNMQPMLRPYIPNVQQFQMQPTSTPFQPAQFIPQSQQPYYQGMPHLYYLQTPNQGLQQQPQQPTQVGSATTQQTNNGKPKPKRPSSKIVIRDPTSHKDVTTQILSQGTTANGRSGDTPPLATSTAQAESSTIQAQFAAQVAAAVGDKGLKQADEKKAEDIDKNNKEHEAKTTDQTEETKTTDQTGEAKLTKTKESHENKKGNGVIADDIHAKESNTDTPNKGISILNEDRTDTPKTTTDSTHLNQASPTLGEMTEKLTMSVRKECQSEPKVVLLRADRETTKNGTSEINEKATEDLKKIPENENINDNMVVVKTANENMVDPSPSVEKNADTSTTNDRSSDTAQNGVVDKKPLDDNATQTDVSPDKIEKKIDAKLTTDAIEVTGNKEDISKQEEISKEEETHEPLIPEKLATAEESPEVPPSQEVTKPQEKCDENAQISEQLDQQQQLAGEQEQEIVNGQQKQHTDTCQQQEEQLEADKQQQQEQHEQVEKMQQKEDTPKPDKQQPQPQKTTEPPKKKSSKQRLKDLNKKETGGDLMDAYTDKPPPQEPVVEEKVKPVEIIPEQSEKPLEEDLSWEDKGEKIGDEIKVEKENDTEAPVPVEQTKRKYERDFLLQFQFMQMCTEKPAGLPDIDVVLDAPAPPSKGGNPPRGGSDFLPNFARQKSQGGGGRRDSRGKPPPRKIITAAPPPPVVLKQSENRWQRPQEKESELTEEEKKTTELYRCVVAILNKLTPQKFKTLVEQISALNIDTPERLEGVIDRIFEKAIGEPVFSVAYANMCRCLFPIKVPDADGVYVSFRKLLLNRCQKEFEKEKEDEKEMKEKQTEMDALSEEDKKGKKEEMDELMAKNKRRMLGNIKFIGELFKLKLLTENIMHDCIFKLLRGGDEESLESMCKLLGTIGKDLDCDKAKPRIEQYFERINGIISGKKVSSRVQFMLRDVVELRQNKWVPRREEHYNPKTIDQIHKEAQQEKIQEQRMAANLPSKDNKQKKGGGSGGRDSPKPTSDGWITTGKSGKPVTVDHNKLKSMAKRANNEDIQLGPSGPRFGQWGRGSSAGLNNTSSQEQEPQGNRFSALSGGDMPISQRPYDPRRSSSTGSRPSSAGSRGSDKRQQMNSDRDAARASAVEAARSLSKPQNEKPQTEKPQVTQPPPPPSQEKPEVKIVKEPEQSVKDVKESLSEEELMKKTTALIDEYVNIQDLKEAVTCFTELHSPNLHDLFILTAVEHTYEMKANARQATGRLFGELLARNKLNMEQLTAGLSRVLEVAQDNAIDYPMLWQYLAEIITQVILREQFTLCHLKPLIIEHLIPCSKAAVLLAEILLVTKDAAGESKAVQIWTDVGISWSEVLPERLTEEDFLSRKNLNFLPSGNDELLKLLRADQFKNDTVFAHIEKNYKEEKRKEAHFINQLVTAVAESCITNKDQEKGPVCCDEKLKARKDILRKYLDNNNTLELEALFALQELYVKYKKPADLLSQFFNTLYDEDVITEAAFVTWKKDEDPKRQEAKGPALQATASFFEWLQSAPVESSEN